MEQLRKKNMNKIKMVIGIYSMLFVYLLVVVLLDLPDKERGFLMGLSLPIFAGLLPYLIKLLIAIHSERKLKLIAIKQKDERLAHIRQKTSRLTLMIFAITLSMASLVFFFIDMKIFYTLMAVMTFMAIIKMILLLIYHKKY